MCKNLANHNASMMLVDTDTGCISAILGANQITSLRTAAAGAVASKRLAAPSSTSLAIIGAGDQAHSQLKAHLCLFPKLEIVTVWNRDHARAEAFVDTWRSLEVDVKKCATSEEAVRDADIIVTTTASRKPILFKESVKPGCHISAVGSDAPGKQELDAYLVQSSTLFVDKREQSMSIGEMQQPLALGLADESHIQAELSEVCAGLHPGRISNEEVTIFDSTGVSFQDLVLAEYLQAQALRRGLGQYLTR
jgi:ornithine cyclodeaminase/alanine dehydrogenase-like protein (mu-crystallin family)